MNQRELGTVVIEPGNETRYREILESALLGIYVSRPDGTLEWCNEAFARILGFSSIPHAIGTNMTEVYSQPRQREAFIRHMREHGRIERFVSRLRRRDGQAIYVLSNTVGVFDERGELAELRGFLMDVTDHAEAEAALKEREQQFRAVFIDAADAMLILDDTRRIVEANRAAGALLGVDEASLVSRTLDELVADTPTELEAVWREVLALGEAKREHRVVSATRPRRMVECSYRAAVQADRHLCIARDITERRTLEERLIQSEKIESVGRLAGGVAHDFNNLLTAILGYTELLLGNKSLNDPDRPDLEEIQRAGKRAASLTQQLLAYSRKQVLMPKEVDLNKTVTGLQAMLTRLIREDISLGCELATRPALVRIDPTQLEQVILNLVLNARDAIAGGGAIRLEVAVVSRAEVEVPADVAIPADSYVRLRVVDNGVGIAPEARAHLFEPFFTTKDIGKGTGLGLASVYGIVRQSNGFITVDSELGHGATFTMHFPAVRAASLPGTVEAIGTTEPAPGGRGGPERRETILLVEDEDAVRTIVSAVLHRNGYTVLEAATPRAACKIFEEHATDVDLLLTDVVMPEMNGPALAQRLVGVRPELRILFMSGYADVTSPLNAGNPNVGFISKPFQASALIAKVREVLTHPATLA